MKVIGFYVFGDDSSVPFPPFDRGNMNDDVLAILRSRQKKCAITDG